MELCATVDAQYAKRLKRRRLKPPPSHQKCSVLLSVGKIIEERWHCLWLRSLEWQCFLEQFTHHKSKVRNQVFHMGKTNHLSAIFWGRYLSSNNPQMNPLKECPLTTHPCTHMRTFFISSHFKSVFFFTPGESSVCRQEDIFKVMISCLQLMSL